MLNFQGGTLKYRLVAGGLIVLLLGLLLGILLYGKLSNNAGEAFGEPGNVGGSRGSANSSASQPCSSDPRAQKIFRHFRALGEADFRVGTVDWVDFKNFSPKTCHVYSREATRTLDVYLVEPGETERPAVYYAKITEAAKGEEIDYSKDGEDCGKKSSVKYDKSPIYDYYAVTFEGDNIANPNFFGIGNEEDFTREVGKKTPICSVVVGKISKTIGTPCPCSKSVDKPLL